MYIGVAASIVIDKCIPGVHPKYTPSMMDHTGSGTQWSASRKVSNGSRPGQGQTQTQTQLEKEYTSVKQENAKLKEVITTLKQEIDLYSRVVSRSRGVRNSDSNPSSISTSNPNSSSGGMGVGVGMPMPMPMPMGMSMPLGMGMGMETLLVNPKRRKTMCLGSGSNVNNVTPRV